MIDLYRHSAPFPFENGLTGDANHRQQRAQSVGSAPLGVSMATPSVAAGVFKLAVAGKQAGFTVEQMIELLNAGITVKTLLKLIGRKLFSAPLDPQEFRSSRWVM